MRLSTNLRCHWKLLPGEFEEFEIEEPCSSPEKQLLRHRKAIYNRTSSCVEKGDAVVVVVVAAVAVTAVTAVAAAVASAAVAAAAAAVAVAPVAAAGVVEAAEEAL
jgi:hypothetical protein